jgi:hypothetical protein
MENQLSITSPQELDKKNQILVKLNIEHISVGKIFADREHFIKIRNICFAEKWNSIEKCMGEDQQDLKIFYDYTRDFGKTWDSYGSEDLKRFNERFPFEKMLETSIEDFLEQVNKVIRGEVSLESLRDSDESVSSETALISTHSKEHLEMMRKSALQRKKCAEIISEGVRIEMAKRMAELDSVRRSLDIIVGEFRDKVKKIEKVIYTIELYLGIKENIVQIQEGVPASYQETIHFWQNTLFMDEEVGDPMDDGRGLDFSSIEKFDEWLLKYSNFYKKFNYELLIPQQKGLICLRVRREDKKYHDNPFINSMLNQDNRKTYILMRNGTNIYRIWGDIIIMPKLFPDKNELQNLKDKWDALTDAEEEKGRIHSDVMKYDTSDNTQKQKDDINDSLFRYKQYLIMLQGLLDRTEIFYPLPVQEIKLTSTDAIESGYIKFVYDDDLRLTDGMPSFKVWRGGLNDHITEGSRILYIDSLSAGPHEGRDDLKYRFDKRFQGYGERFNLPSRPNSGIYQVRFYTETDIVRVQATANCKEELPNYVKVIKPSDYFDNPSRFPYKYDLRNQDGDIINEQKETKTEAIYYNPKDEVRNSWSYYNEGHSRKLNLSFKIYKNYDENILNYDLIDLNHVEYYLNERRHRIEYLKMIPILYNIKKLREEEKKKEVEFVRGLVEDMKRNKRKLKDPEKEIWDAIEWFKLKNKWKRSLTEYDELAWRMVKKRLGLEERSNNSLHSQTAESNGTKYMTKDGVMHLFISSKSDSKGVLVTLISPEGKKHQKYLHNLKSIE